MSLDDDLKVLDWTDRQLRTDNRAVIPAMCAPILDRLDWSEETWFDLVKNFRKRLRPQVLALLTKPRRTTTLGNFWACVT